MVAPEGAATSLPRRYHDINLHKPREYWDYEILAINWGCQDEYGVGKKIGHGRYGEVYEGIRFSSGEKCVVKILKPVQRHRLKREICILQNLRNGTNIVKLLDIVRDPTSKTPSLVFERINSIEHGVLFPTFTGRDIRFYVSELLKALDFCHSHGIMHRDVKPQNIVYDPDTKQLRLIDWGLAEFYHPGKNYNVRVASRYYKGPELLLGFERYDYSLDVWSVGCILASMVFRKDPFFMGSDNNNQLEKIVALLGYDDLCAYCNKYRIDQQGIRMGASLGRGTSQKPWSKFVTSENRHLADPEIIDLLDGMIAYDHAGRLLPSEALQHRCFSSPSEPTAEQHAEQDLLEHTDTSPMLAEQA